MVDKIDELARPCPRCFAPAGAACHSREGQPRAAAHVSRLRQSGARELAVDVREREHHAFVVLRALPDVGTMLRVHGQPPGETFYAREVLVDAVTRAARRPTSPATARRDGHGLVRIYATASDAAFGGAYLDEQNDPFALAVAKLLPGEPTVNDVGSLAEVPPDDETAGPAGFLVDGAGGLLRGRVFPSISAAVETAAVALGLDAAEVVCACVNETMPEVHVFRDEQHEKRGEVAAVVRLASARPDRAFVESYHARGRAMLGAWSSRVRAEVEAGQERARMQERVAAELDEEDHAAAEARRELKLAKKLAALSPEAITRVVALAQGIVRAQMTEAGYGIRAFVARFGGNASGSPFEEVVLDLDAECVLRTDADPDGEAVFLGGTISEHLRRLTPDLWRELARTTRPVDPVVAARWEPPAVFVRQPDGFWPLAKLHPEEVSS